MLSEVIDKHFKEERRKGIREGIRKGRREGIQQGIQLARQEDALKMLKKGYPIEDVMEITGLSRQEIEALMKGEK